MRVMFGYFMAGADLARWDLTELDEAVYRLRLAHPFGIITEYFKTVRAALDRQSELEGLLMAGRGPGAELPGSA